MHGIIDIITKPETLTITNVVLAVCILFHLFCEFAHYIHEFLSHRKERKQSKANGELLKEVKVLLVDAKDVLEKISKVQEQRAKNCKCPDINKEE